MKDLQKAIEEIIKEHSYFIVSDVENFNLPKVIEELMKTIDAMTPQLKILFGVKG